MPYIPPSLEKLSLNVAGFITWGTERITVKKLQIYNCQWHADSQPIPIVSSQTALSVSRDVAEIEGMWRLNEGIESEIQTLVIIGFFDDYSLSHHPVCAQCTADSL